MKISKLFHWLYALIMFLPVFFWIPTAFYYGFNEHAFAQDKIKEEPVYYQTNTIEVYSDFLVDRVYKWEDNFTPVVTNQSRELMTIKMVSGQYIDTQGILYSGSSGSLIYYTNGNYNTVDNIPFDFLVISIGNQISELPNGTLIHFVSSNLYVIKEYQEVTYTQSITDSMNNSWDDVWTLPMFSWTHDTFFSAPFNYIAGLFGIQVGNTLSYCLSYWFSISIIWLVFDLMLYVPLLVHRWLDKAGIQ